MATRAMATDPATDQTGLAELGVTMTAIEQCVWDYSLGRASVSRSPTTPARNACSYSIDILGRTKNAKNLPEQQFPRTELGRWWAHSERAICREAQVNLAYRWFCGLSIEDGIPNHSAFTRARNERFRDSDSPLPVQAPTKYELTINLKTASALGPTVPLSLLSRTDVVIE